jgi:hypothetical protein
MLLGHQEVGMVSAEHAIHHARAEWNQAVRFEDLSQQWRNDHPDASLSDWMEWDKQSGKPSYGEPGRLTPASLRGVGHWWYMRLSRPTEWGRYVVECRNCRQIALRHNYAEGGGLCHDCRAPELERRKAVQAERRIERRRERSKQLANRKGLCRVCGSEMTVARGTKTTCSERCRKQWLRKGEEAFPLPEAPTEVKIGTMDPMPLDQAHTRLFDRLMHHTMTRPIKLGEPDPVGDDIRRILDLVIHLKTFAQLREEAPAVFLYELSQQGGAAAPSA